MSARASYYACVLSIQWLFRPADQRELTDPPAPTACYLWTFTFPDALTRGEPRLAMKRWDSFRVWLHKTGKVLVRSIERGEKGAYHFHAATPQFWAAREIWDAGERYGFGRVDVRKRPISAAYYLAKYVGKGAGGEWLPRGMRQWACVGFEGVPIRRLKAIKRTRVVVPDTEREKLFDVLEWSACDTVAFRHRYRPTHDGADEVLKMELKPAQVKHLVSKCVQGLMCVVGEFRGVQIRTIGMEDPKTKQRVERVLVEYSVELGGVPNVVTEWTKAGTQVADVKPVAVNRGEAVLVLVESVGWYKGAKKVSGKIEVLPALV